MTIEELIAKLENVSIDPEEGHIEADTLLLEYIADERVSELHAKAAVWFA